MSEDPADKHIPDAGMQLPDPGQLQPEDTLIDRGTDPSGADGDPLDEGYTMPERLVEPDRWLNQDETLDDRVKQEEPDTTIPNSGYGPQDSDGIADDGGADVSRVGRLVAPDEGLDPVDTEAGEVASDAGFAGGGASAEEAAVHATDADELTQDETDPELRDPELHSQLDAIDEQIARNDG